MVHVYMVMGKYLLDINFMILSTMYFYGFSQTDRYDKDMNVHYIYFKESQVEISKLVCTSVPEDCISHSKQCRPR